MNELLWHHYRDDLESVEVLVTKNVETGVLCFQVTTFYRDSQNGEHQGMEMMEIEVKTNGEIEGRQLMGAVGATEPPSLKVASIHDPELAGHLRNIYEELKKDHWPKRLQSRQGSPLDKKGADAVSQITNKALTRCFSEEISEKNRAGWLTALLNGGSHGKGTGNSI
ncbi:MAG: hypothetical protein SFW64_02065 [Alphaproteobacteria bacterium]|nr:hypothetical protein [Alphaproteobacteria bacterium]